MTKNMRKMTAALLAFCLCFSLLGATALAAESYGPGVTDVPTLPGGAKEEVDVNIHITEISGTTETEINTPAGGDTTASGIQVQFDSTMTEKTDENGELIFVEGESSYTADSADGTYHAQGGSETSTDEVPVTDITVELPLKEGESSTVTTGSTAGSQTVSGDVPAGEGDGVYDYTTETVLKPGSVTVTTGEITRTEIGGEGNTDLEYVVNETDPTADNDLSGEKKYPADLPEEGEEIPVKDGYGYVYVGMGNHSQYWSGLLYTTPSPEFPDEEPIVIEGKKYYVRRDHKGLGKKHTVERFYRDGKLLLEDTKQWAIWSNVTQYIMIDGETGEYITTYCADLNTPAEDGFSYNLKNIEDGTYYSEEQAAMIRAVAQNGYWGVEDDANTAEAEQGSLEAVREMMRSARDKDGNAVFTEAEIAGLTDGVAMSATQWAIWTFSNAMEDVEFVGTHFLAKDSNNMSNFGAIGDIPEDKEDEVDLLFKLYNHMIGLDPAAITEKTTENTVISSENFLKDASLTVIEKVQDHANNLDTDDTNDAYKTELTFSLVVTPSTENGDDLVVMVIDENGNELARGRIAGEPAEGEKMLVAKDGNYTLDNIVMTEGNQNFRISLSGIQHLGTGVYLYTSEIRETEEAEPLSSQTMVGIASGQHAVNVSVNISFELNVEEEIVAKERVWRTEEYIPVYGDDDDDDIPGDDDDDDVPGDDDDDITIIGDDDVPLIEIPPDVPLVNVPKTGDGSALWTVLAAASALGLGAVRLSARKRKD